MLMARDDEGNLRKRVKRLEELVSVLVATPMMFDEDYPPFRYRFEKHPFEERLNFLVSRLRDWPQFVEQAETTYRNVAGIADKHEALESKLRLEVGRLDRRFDTDERTTAELRLELHAWLAVHSLGLDGSRIPLIRYFPVRFFLSDGNKGSAAAAMAAISQLLAALDSEIADEFPPVRGSLLQRLFGRTTSERVQAEVEDGLEKGKRALELQLLGVKQAEIDEKMSSAVEKLAKAAEHEPECVYQVGSILYVKAIGQDGITRSAVQTLSQSAMIQIEKNPYLLKSPSEILDRLHDLSNGTKTEGGRASVGGYDRIMSPPNSSPKAARLGERTRLPTNAGAKESPLALPGPDPDGNMKPK
jgi:hypothetical protein